MGELFPVLESLMGDTFPELRTHRDRVLRALKAEEESFAATLDRGLALFEEVAGRLKEAKQSLFPGESAFKLYDTYGFPLDLTTLMASERNLSVDQETFDQLMEQQRERARLDRKSAVLAHDADLVQDVLKRGVRTEFRGYACVEQEADVLVCVSNGHVQDQLAEGESGELVLSQTAFYSESGGQLGDRGVIRGPHGEFKVLDTQRPVEGLVLHIGQVTQGTIQTGERVAALVDQNRRAHLELHHTATHLLNAALRELVSATVRQAGSLVAPDRLRFDFTHYEAIPVAKLEAIERRVNGWIMDDLAVQTSSMAYKDVPNSGIIAVFDEKYGDEVRVVDIGGFSRELCGGTHVRATGRLGFFRIVNESSVAAGIRRIEAVCGWPAYEWTQRERELVRSLSQRFSASPEELIKRVDQVLEQNRKLEKELKQKAAASSKDLAGSLLEKAGRIGEVPVLAEVVDGLGMDALRGLLDHVRPKFTSGVVVLGSAADGKASFVATVSEDWVARGVHAGQLIGAIAKMAGGGGGGQPAKAQAGGKDPSKVPAAIAAAKDLIIPMVRPVPG